MREKIHLNFDWEYSPSFRDEYIKNKYKMDDTQIVSIPHSNVELPYNNFSEKDYQIQSCYKKTIFIPESKKGKRVLLHFEGVMAYAKVYLNGNLVTEHKGGYTPFRADLTEYAVYGETNYITVYVDSREREEIPPFGFVIDYLTYGGIYREVFLEYTENIYIENCFVKTKDVLEDNKTLEIELYLQNHIQVDCDAVINVKIKRNEELIKSFSREMIVLGDVNQQDKIIEKINNIVLWDINNPALYDMQIELKTDIGTIDNYSARLGFREAVFTPEGFYLNGKKIKLRGLNRHQSFPYVGYAMPKSAQYKDADILKYDLGVNIVRLSHYPQSNHFLDRCDEIGLLVFDEIPGWQHVGEKGEWWDLVQQNTNDMIKKDWNRPSVIIWGVRINESEDIDELYTATNNIAKKLDGTRATTGVRCIGGSKLIDDVYSYNDFIYDGSNIPLEKRKDIAKGKVPYLITEHNGHMFPTKKYDNIQRRIEHALRHMTVMDAVYKDNEIVGGIGWCMTDYNTHKEFGSGDKICYHGIMDMYRIDKYAAKVYASQSDNKPVMEIAQTMANGDMDKSTRGDVYIFTNCDYINLYVNDRFIKRFYPRKDLFANVDHPPVLIDDFIGDTLLNNEKFNKKDSYRIKKLLIKADKVGENLSIIDKIKMGILFLKYGLNMKDGRDLYTKYFGGWGRESTNYRFEGYINEKCVIKKIKSQVFEPKLKVEIDSDELIEDVTYDVTRVVVRMQDEHNEDIIYANDVIKVKTDEKLQVIGPTDLALIGGSIAFWIKTTGENGVSNITISSHRFGDIKRQIKVWKREVN